MLNLRNAHIAMSILGFIAMYMYAAPISMALAPLWRPLMSHADLKKWQCRMSLSLEIPLAPCRIQEKAMSHATIFLGPTCPCHPVEFKKCPCRPVDSRGQGPYLAGRVGSLGMAPLPAPRYCCLSRSGRESLSASRWCTRCDSHQLGAAQGPTHCLSTLSADGALHHRLQGGPQSYHMSNLRNGNVRRLSLLVFPNVTCRI